ncbi:MAG: hypothetical protein KC503_37300 [Myxococcales bacterium]|nr:hypothetical protein [Myxococcales bacterium]
MDERTETLFESLDGLLAAPKLDPDVVVGLFSAEIEGNVERSTRAFAVFEGPCSGDIAVKLEMRIPIEPKGRQDALIIVTLPRSMTLTTAQVFEHYGREYAFSLSDPERVERRTSFRYKHDGGDLSFVFDGNEERALEVVIDRAGWR